jgi:4-amino-4-deoxy-L-arabinose transferase-like glycosyltransferase
MVIAAGALVLRVTYLLANRGSDVFGDGLAYYAQAMAQAHGVWFMGLSGPTAQHPPAWVLVLTAAMRFGLTAQFQLQLVSTVIGTGSVIVVGLIGRHVGGDRVGWLAAGLAAIWPAFWVFERDLLSETLVLLLVACLTLAVYRFYERPSLRRALVVGVGCGLVTLTRSEDVLGAVIVVGACLLSLARSHRVTSRQAAGQAAVIAGATLVLLLPWIAYNQGRFQHQVLFSTGLGPLVGGSYCSPTYHGALTGGFQVGCDFYGLRGARHMDESSVDLVLRSQAWDFAKQHPGRLPLVVVAREGRTFGFWAPMQQARIEANWQNSPDVVLVGAMVGGWLLLVPAVAGVVVLRRRKTPLAPLVGFLVCTIIVVGLSYGQARFAASASVGYVVLAAVGLDAGAARVGRARVDRAAALQ